ncbi:MAG TPA: potassium/proton antiporter [Solirubrobacteraceae bacterium]|nr:potassium/proton antiporter [Solirubrobacteraceae bacterium]
MECCPFLPVGERILIAGALLAAALAASLLAGRLRLPGLVLFLALGMLVGSDALGWIHFQDYELAETVGVISLALILFEGGLAAGWREIRPVLRPAVGLALPGTVITAVVSGLAASWLFGLSTLEGLLIGAIISSTDGAAVFSLLRGSGLRRRLERTLEGEAGFNDPIAVLLVLGFIEWIQHPDFGLVDMVELFAQQLGIGLVAGLAVGSLAAQAFTRVRLGSPGLYPVASLATVALAFGAADALEGSEFLAAYLAGLTLGSADIPARRTVTAFHEGLAWVAQLGMFLTLGLLVFPADLDEVALEGTALALVVVFVARPIATVVATVGSGFELRERALLGWAGLRGAVPVVLAIFPFTHDIDRDTAETFFNIVFFAVLLSTLLQGMTVEPVARRLGVTSGEPESSAGIVEVGVVRQLGGEVIEHTIAPGDAAAGARIRELGLPRDALVSLVVRGSEALLPRGSTRLEAGDRLLVLVRREVARDLAGLVARWKTGPIGAPVRPPRTYTGTVPVYTARPWKAHDGDPSHPTEVAGHRVVEKLRTRRDVPGALVILADGRYAVCGPILMVGPPGQLQAQARRRLAREEDDAAQAWWQEVIGACAL